MQVDSLYTLRGRLCTCIARHNLQARIRCFSHFSSNNNNNLFLCMVKAIAQPYKHTMYNIGLQQQPATHAFYHTLLTSHTKLTVWLFFFISYTHRL